MASTVSNPLVSTGAVPIAMLQQQLLVTSQAGVRQVLFPVNISGVRQFVGARGAATRFISVRQVTVGGTSGFISLPARLAAPITMRTVINHQDTQSVNATIASAVPTTTANSAESRVTIQEILNPQVLF